MPGLKRKYNSRTYTAPRKAQKTRYASVGLVRQPRFILGKTQKGTLRYAEKISIVGSAVEGSLKTHVFSANGCYDPNITGIGHQPRGFDQLMSLYDHYTVIKSTIAVRFLNDSNARPYCAIAVRDDNSVFADLQSVNEYGDKVMSTKPIVRFSDTCSDTTAYLSTKTSIGSFLGRGDVLSDPELKGSVTGNPAEQVYYHVIVGDPHQTTGTSVKVLVTVTYDVIFHEPKQPTSS